MDTIELPIIDLAKDKDEATADELVKAAATHGFIYIKNNGVEIKPSNLDGVFELVCWSAL